MHARSPSAVVASLALHLVVAAVMVALSLMIQRAQQAQKPPVFRIRMDAKATAQHFISVMDALKQNNLSRVTFDTQVGP